MSEFLNSRLRQLVPYTPGEQPRDRQYIKLNTNESPYPPAPGVVAALGERQAAQELCLYPDPQATDLKRALAAQYGVRPQNVLVCNGSDEALHFALLAYAADGRGAAFADITYGFYQVLAQLYQIPVCRIALRDDFSLCPQDYIGLHRTIVIANPNAPTGLLLDCGEIERIVRANADSVVIIDEAYIDFGGKSCVGLIEKYENLLVVQTFSKSRAMAGARLGYAIGSPARIADLETIRCSVNPYNINRLTLLAGTRALAEQEYFNANCRRIVQTRSETTAALQELGFFVLPSQANFVFAKKPGISGERIYRELRQRGVLVRHFDQDRIRDFVRITIGTPEQMQALITRLEEIL